MKFLFLCHYESYQMNKIDKFGFYIRYKYNRSITQKNNVQLLKTIYLLIKYKKLDQKLANQEEIFHYFNNLIFFIKIFIILIIKIASWMK